MAGVAFVCVDEPGDRNGDIEDLWMDRGLSVSLDDRLPKKLNKSKGASNYS